jgi:hypothetical protein
METIQIKIDVNKIEKARLFKGAKGTYLDATLVMRDEPDQYGNIGFVTQQISKEEREAGTKAPIIGNVTKRFSKDTAKQAPAKPVTPIVSTVDDSDLPF